MKLPQSLPDHSRLFRPESLPGRLHQRVIGAHWRALHAVAHQRPLPLGYWRAAGRLSLTQLSWEQSLSPVLYEPRRTAPDVAAPELSELLAGRPLGTWALDVETIDYVWNALAAELPEVVIECGAGTSTHLFAAHFKRQAQAPSALPSVLTLEQDEQIARSTQEELRRAGLDSLVRVLFFPLDQQSSYAVDADAMRAALGDQQADWIFVDGPGGLPGCRWRTLLDLMRYARPGARWFLDDALRLYELGVLELWARYPGITVEGIIPLGKGLATGTLTAPGSC